jgi:hypothetical protein
MKKPRPENSGRRFGVARSKYRRYTAEKVKMIRKKQAQLTLAEARAELGELGGFIGRLAA